jgi:hypothetical protein
MDELFPDDVNIVWTYNDQNLYVQRESTKTVAGVHIHRKLNHPIKNYSTIEEPKSISYVFSAKHLVHTPPPTILVHQVAFTTNRFPGNSPDAFQLHRLQIE